MRIPAGNLVGLSLYEIIREIGACERRDIVCLGGALLRLCRTHEAILWSRYDHAANRGKRCLQSNLARIFRDHDDEVVSHRLCDLLAEAYAKFENIDAVVVARVTADALDEALGERFAGCFRDRGTIPLQEGDPLPMAAPPLKAMYGKDLSPDPYRLTSQNYIGRTRRLCIAPRMHDGWRVDVRWGTVDLLSEMAPGARIAIAPLPTPLHSIEMDRYERDGEPLFFDVRPADRRAHADALVADLGCASDGGATVVVLPELSVDEVALAAIDAWCRENDSVVVIAGSSHISTDEDLRYNRATMRLAGRAISEHDKFSRFTFRDPVPPAVATYVDRREDLTVGSPRLTFLVLPASLWVRPSWGPCRAHRSGRRSRL